MADHYYSRNWQTEGTWPPAIPQVSVTDQTFALPSHNQPDSSLLQTLPYEVRVLVYQQVILELDRNLLHIYIPQPGAYHRQFEQFNPRICQPCICGDGNYLQSAHWEGKTRTGSWGSTHLVCRDASRMNTQAVPELKTIFALASCCRHLYHEVLPTFYSMVIIHLTHLNTVQYFFQPKSHRLQMLQTIHISWMIFGSLDASSMYFEFGDRSFTTDIERLNELCKILSTLPALKDLRMIFFHTWYTISESQLLRPLLQIKNLRSFQVQLPWSKEDAIEPFDEEVFFEIDRRPVPLYVDDVVENMDRGNREVGTGSRRRGDFWRQVGPRAIYVTGRATAKGVKKLLSKAG